MSYNDFVAQCIDQYQDHWTMINNIMKADINAHISVPYKKWIAFDQLLSAKPLVQGEALKQLEGYPTHCHLNEIQSTQQLRQVLQSEEWSIQRVEKLPTWKVKMNKILPMWDDLFGEQKRGILQDYGILNIEGTWCEVQFQQFVKIIAQLQRRQLSVTRGHFLLMMHRMATIGGRIRSDNLPFEWLLGNTHKLSITQRSDVFVLAQYLIDRVGQSTLPLDGSISKRDLAHLQRIFRWIFRDGTHREPLFLTPLLTFLKHYRDFKGDNMQTMLEFITHHWNKKPDHFLLVAYMNGEVDINGKGRYQNNN